MNTAVEALAAGGPLAGGRPASATLAALLEAAGLGAAAPPASAHDAAGHAGADTAAEPGRAALEAPASGTTDTELAGRLASPAGQALPAEAGHAAGQAPPAAAALDTGPASVAAGLMGASGFSGPSALGELAAPPLTPAWVTALHTLPPDLHARLRAPRDDARRRSHRDGRGHAGPAPDDAEGAGDDDAPQPPHADEPPPPGGGPATTPSRRLPHPLHAQLPPPLQAELARGRAVLLWAPQHRGVQAWWLGFERGGRPACRRLAARGEGPADAAWRWWWLKRAGEDGTAARPLCRGAEAGSPALALRVCSATEAPPRAGAGVAWLDLTDPPRLWRDLGTQWTWLAAWSPRPLPWMR
jgi:hypothetical protein